MPGISIVTDTDSSLSAEIAASFNIRQVPIFIHFGEEIYETGMNINDRSLFERVDKEGKLPTTAAPTPGKFAEVFSQSFKEDGSESLICFCISSAMSATVEAARTTAREILPDKDITIVDTETLSMRQGYMVLAAAEAV